MWKRILKLMLICSLLLAAWLSGRWLVEPSPEPVRFDLISSPAWEPAGSQRRQQVNTAKQKVGDALALVKQDIEKLSPKLNERLRPPADRAEIDRLESAIGRQLPAEYRAFLELHDGTSGFYPVLLFYSAHQARQQFEEWLDEKISWTDYGWFFEVEQGRPSPRFLKIADTGNWDIWLDLETGETLIVVPAADSAKHCDSISHIFDTLRAWKMEKSDDGELWVPRFGAAYQ